MDIQTPFAEEIARLATTGVFINDYRNLYGCFGITQPENDYAKLGYDMALGFYVDVVGLAGYQGWLRPADALAASARLFDMSHQCDKLNKLLAEHTALLAKPEPKVIQLVLVETPVADLLGVHTVMLSPTITPSGDFKKDVEHFVALLQKRQDEHDQNSGYPFKSEFKVEINRVYVRILKAQVGQQLSGSVWCFLDKEGNILKPDGAKKPAKGIRGNIYNPTYALAGTSYLGPDYNNAR